MFSLLGVPAGSISKYIQTQKAINTGIRTQREVQLRWERQRNRYTEECQVTGTGGHMHRFGHLRVIPGVSGHHLAPPPQVCLQDTVATVTLIPETLYHTLTYRVISWEGGSFCSLHSTAFFSWIFTICWTLCQELYMCCIICTITLQGSYVLLSSYILQMWTLMERDISYTVTGGKARIRGPPSFQSDPS